MGLKSLKCDECGKVTVDVCPTCEETPLCMACRSLVTECHECHGAPEGDANDPPDDDDDDDDEADGYDDDDDGDPAGYRSPLWDDGYEETD